MLQLFSHLQVSGMEIDILPDSPEAELRSHLTAMVRVCSFGILTPQRGKMDFLRSFDLVADRLLTRCVFKMKVSLHYTDGGCDVISKLVNRFGGYNHVCL